MAKTFKRSTCLSVVLLLLISIFSFSISAQEYTDYVSQPNYRVSKISRKYSNGKYENQTYKYTEDGKIKKYVYEDNGFRKATVYTYDDGGNLSKEYRREAIGVYSKIYYAYGEKGNLIKKVIKSRNTSNSNIYQSFTYDDNGNLIKDYVNNNGYKTVNTYNFNDDNALLKHFLKKSDGTYKNKYYDADGKLIREKSGKGDTFYYDYSYKYNEKGDLTEEVTKTAGGSNTTTYENEYDESGNILESKKLINGELEGQTTYEYNEKGELIEKTTTAGLTWIESVKKETFEYDKYGNMTKHLFDYNGERSRTSWTYDKHGRLLHKTNVDEEGSTTVDYSYYKDGKLKSRSYVDDYEMDVVTYYFYDAQGRISKQVYKERALFSKNFEYRSEKNYVYDKNGCLSRISYKDSDDGKNYANADPETATSYEITFKYKAFDLGEAKVSDEVYARLSQTKFAYDGTAKEPQVILSNGEGNGRLHLGVDYTMKYYNNTEVGKAKAKIIFKGDYKELGTKTLAFKIVK